MEKQYNYIYSKLVSNQADVVGMLAYSIYKQHKIEFIKDFKQKKGFAPTDTDIDNFIMSSVTASQLEKYKESAVAILSETVATNVQEELSKMTFDFQEAIEPVVEKHSYSCGKTILLNVMGSLAFSVILAIIFMLGYTTESDLRTKTKAFVETIRDTPSDSIPTK